MVNGVGLVAGTKGYYVAVVNLENMVMEAILGTGAKTIVGQSRLGT